jgi:hypothetical protein
MTTVFTVNISFDEAGEQIILEEGAGKNGIVTFLPTKKAAHISVYTPDDIQSATGMIFNTFPTKKTNGIYPVQDESGAVEVTVAAEAAICISDQEPCILGFLNLIPILTNGSGTPIAYEGEGPAPIITLLFSVREMEQ